jgi:hypothetical protein
MVLVAELVGEETQLLSNRREGDAVDDRLMVVVFTYPIALGPELWGFTPTCDFACAFLWWTYEIKRVIVRANLEIFTISNAGSQNVCRSCTIWHRTSFP